jgi:hypothetical protein
VIQFKHEYCRCSNIQSDDQHTLCRDAFKNHPNPIATQYSKRSRSYCNAVEQTLTELCIATSNVCLFKILTFDTFMCHNSWISRKLSKGRNFAYKVTSRRVRLAAPWTPLNCGTADGTGTSGFCSQL